MKFVVKHKETGLYLINERRWESGRSCVSSQWIHGVAHGTRFLSAEDAWRGFDVSGAGARPDYDIEEVAK